MIEIQDPLILKTKSNRKTIKIIAFNFSWIYRETYFKNIEKY